MANERSTCVGKVIISEMSADVNVFPIFSQAHDVTELENKLNYTSIFYTCCWPYFIYTKTVLKVVIRCKGWSNLEDLLLVNIQIFLAERG